MEARNFATVGLSLMLAANCFMPCYTLAYADESQEVAYVPQEEQEEIAGGSAGGLEFSPGVGESISYAADGGAAGEGYGPYDGAAEGAGEDTTSDNGAVIDPFVYNVDPSPDYPLLEEGDGSFDDSYGGSLADDYLVADYGVSPLAIGAGTVIDTLIASSVTGSWTGHAIGNYSWTAREGTLYNLVSILLEQVNNRFSAVQNNQTYANNYLKAIDSSGKSSVTELTSILAYAKWVYSLSQKQWGYGYGGTIVIEKGSPMDLLGKVQRNSDYVTSLYGLIQEQWGYGFGGTVVTEKGSPFDLLGKIQRNSDYITSLDSRVEIANDLLGKIQRNSDFITSLDSRVSIVNDLLGKIQRNSDFVTSIDSRLERYYPAHSNLVSKGFSDVLDRLGSLSVSVQVDFSGVESRLDSIIRLLTVAGVVENARDVLDAIFGDMSLDATGAASAAVGSAIQNAFPFCVPAVLKQILGLLQADPAPPEFHFDFWGAPLDFGFSDWQGLADMTSWLSRIGFAVVLFANSRRFVYSGGVAGD